MTVGIRKIAQMAGTSVSTVSRVVNKSGYVSAETRQRIETAIEALDYRPYAGARMLRGSPSKVVGVLLPSLDVPFFGILGHSIEQAFFKIGYQTFICSTAESPAKEATYVEMLLSQKLDGAIIASSRQNIEPFIKLKEHNIPIVAVDRPMPGLTDVCVHVDNHKGGTILAEHLLGLGHRKIGIICAPRHTEPMIQRVSGLTDALRSHGLEPSDIRYGSEHSLHSCYRLANMLLDRHGDVTAIVGTSDTAAIAAMHAAIDRGMSVPARLSVAGFDDLPEASYVLPRLTTIYQPIAKIGETAVQRLLGMMSGDGPFASEDKLPIRIRVRESTAHAAICESQGT
jgi:LacI family transcriptional regulator